MSAENRSRLMGYGHPTSIYVDATTRARIDHLRRMGKLTSKRSLSKTLAPLLNELLDALEAEK